MKKFFSLIFLIAFLAFLWLPALNVQAAAGCCVENLGTGACTITASKDLCLGGKGRFYEGDITCKSEPKCKLKPGNEMTGCCILDDTKKDADPKNCIKNAKQSECLGVSNLFEAGDDGCQSNKSIQFCGSPAPVPGGGGDGTVNPEFTNPLRFTTVSEALNVLIGNLQGIVALISIVFIIVGGIMYMTAGVDEKMVERAKQTIGGATIGFAIILAAPTFLREIKNILGGNSGGNADEWVNKALTIKEIALKVIEFLLSVVGVLAIIGLVVGGVFYLTAYGDEDQMKKGKNMATYSIIGVAIALAALVIVRQIAKIMGAPIQ